MGASINDLGITLGKDMVQLQRANGRPRFPTLTLLLILVNLVCFMATTNSSLQLREEVAQRAGLVPSVILSGSQAWTLVTHMFLHADIAHITFNMLALLFLGAALEERIGSARFASVFLLSGLIAAAAFVLLNPSSSTPAVGASAAIFGVMGTLTLLYPSSFVLLVFVPVPTLLIAVFYTFGIISIIQSGTSGWVAQEAHLAGLLAGMVIAFEMKPQDAIKGLIAFLGCLVTMILALSLLGARRLR